MVKILHIVDDPKFYDYIKSTFGISGIENKLISSNDLDFFDALLVSEFDFVIIHYLNIKKARWLNKIKPKNVIWFIWGSDIYNLAKFRNTLHLEETNKVLDTFKSPIKRSKLYKNLMFNWMPSLYDLYYNKEKIRAFSNIHKAVPVIPADFELLKIKYGISFPGFNMNYLVPNLKELEKFEINGENILLGNSAHPTNNHLDALSILKKTSIKNGRKIIIPLNYGNSKYRKVLIDAINKIDGLEFVILTKLIPLEKYRNTIRSCNVMFFNTLRQQAFGTILHGLMMGTHIFFNKRSPQYEFLKNNGFIVSPIEENIELKGLSIKDITSNRNKVIEIYGVSENRLKVETLLNLQDN